MPDEVTGAIARLREAVETEFGGLVRAATTIDSTLEKPVESAGNQMLKGITHVEKRIMTRLKQQHEILVRQIAAGRNAILPHGHPQERVINILHFLVRYGPRFLADIEHACGAWARGLEPTSQGP